MISVGSIVESTHGRDKGKLYIVIQLEKGIAYISDGHLKDLNNLKKKNLKHLKFIENCENLDFNKLHNCDIIATVKKINQERKNLGGIN